jgi:hypothetical protein
MAERPLSGYHLGTLWTLHNRGPTTPLRKGEIGPLLKRGLVEPAGARGQYGMTHYRLTERGKEHARSVVLSEGQFKLSERPAAPAPAPAPSGEVPPGHMRMKSGKIVKIAR